MVFASNKALLQRRVEFSRWAQTEFLHNPKHGFQAMRLSQNLPRACAQPFRPVCLQALSLQCGVCRPGSGNEWYTTLDAELTKISNIRRLSDGAPRQTLIGGPTFKYPTDIRRSFQHFSGTNCPLSVRHTQACQIRPICVRYPSDMRWISVRYPSDIRRISVGYSSDICWISVGYESDICRFFCPIYPSDLDNCCEPLFGPSNVPHLNSMGLHITGSSFTKPL